MGITEHLLIDGEDDGFNLAGGGSGTQLEGGGVTERGSTETRSGGCNRHRKNSLSKQRQERSRARQR